MDLRAYIYEEIDKAIQEHKDNIASGTYSLERYMKACGVVGGLELSKQIMEETYRKYLAG